MLVKICFFNIFCAIMLEKGRISKKFEVVFSRNKTSLQPVSRPVEQVHYFGVRVEGAKSLWCQGFADRLKTNVEHINRVNVVFDFFKTFGKNVLRLRGENHHEITWPRV